ncbi:hypothetical protein [uncultured Mucilaginibacter sp.]|uniref:hypothetical protein n=1 Tax=uncultured Mucilaginibacter sp. TaxID=797541 RepID=UPI0025FB7BE8|nr:hypothetical protein [uncultured Mucilaginibacter sp.]
MKPSRYLNNLDSFIAACIGFFAIYLYTAYSGVGISPDSIMYASTATNIQSHFSLLTFNKTPLTFFPVFYPFFLGAIQFITGADPIKAGAMIDATLFAVVIFTTGWIMSKFVAHSRIYKWLILGAIILSPGLLEIYTYLWSETLFILEIMLFIIAYWRYLQTHTLKSLLWVAIITAIACITRYVGITIIGVGGLMLLVDDHLPWWKKKVGHALFYGFISISLLVANLIVNSTATGLSTGTREPSITPFKDNLYYIGTVIVDWGALSNKAYPFAILIASIVLLALIAVLLWKAFKGKINSYENIVIAFTIVYGLFILIWASFQRFERINSRLLSPMFIPLLIACTYWVPDVLNLVKSKAKYILAGIAIILMVAFEYSTYQADYQRYDDEGDYGVPGYSDDDWNKSEFVVYLKQHKNIYKPGAPIFSDANEAVYLFTGTSSELIPHKFFQKDVQKFYAHKQFYLIWFDNLYNTELVNLPDIMKNKKLVKIGAAKEGEIYYCDGR